MRRPLVSVIVVNWNGGEVFRDCLKSLAKIDYPNWQLVVVDNGSTDGSLNHLNTLKGIKIKKITNSGNVGFAPANNQALSQTKGKYILLLNNDTKVEKNFLSVLIDFMEKDSSVGAVQPKILIMDKPEFLDNAGSFITRIGFLHHWGFLQKDTKEYDKEREIFSAKGACLLVRKEIVEKVGLFDKEFVSYFEESDFCWRVWIAGWRVFYYPKTRIYHKVGYTIKRLDVLNINYHYYKNRICSLIKNLNFLNLITILSAHLVISVGIAFVFLFRGSFNNSWMIVKAIFWNIVNLGGTLKKRAQVQSYRKISDDEIFSKLAVKPDWKKFFGDFKRVEKDLNKK